MNISDALANLDGVALGFPTFMCCHVPARNIILLWVSIALHRIILFHSPGVNAWVYGKRPGQIESIHALTVNPIKYWKGINALKREI